MLSGEREAERVLHLIEEANDEEAAK